MAQPTPRIIREAKTLATEKVPGISAVQNPDNFNHFHVTVEGPGDTPYEGGLFHADLLLPQDYPMSPPKILFVTPIYHPNIDKQGRVCLDILKNNWTPALQIRSVLLSLQALLAEPDPNDFLDVKTADNWKEDPKGAEKIAREWTQKYAK
jgi:ubiquitin-conjugating enzyme E2 N